MRISSIALTGLCALAACHRAPLAGAEPMAASDDRIECRGAGAAAFARDCTVERTTGHNGLILTLRHPDGHFRRLAVKRDGRGVASADGAEAARVATISPHEIEVAIGGDHYRLPATVKPGAGATP